MKKKPSKLKLAAETLRILTPGKGQVVGATGDTCITCVDTCYTNCSCGCSQQPCPISETGYTC